MLPEDETANLRVAQNIALLLLIRGFFKLKDLEKKNIKQDDIAEILLAKNCNFK